MNFHSIVIFFRKASEFGVLKLLLALQLRVTKFHLIKYFFKCPWFNFFPNATIIFLVNKHVMYNHLGTNTRPRINVDDILAVDVIMRTEKGMTSKVKVILSNISLCKPCEIK